MADRPILFSGPMVRALLDGRKTQTRRVLSNDRFASIFNGQWADDYVLDPGNQSWRDQEVRYAIGDRLWVREAFSYESLDIDRNGFMPPWYWADGNPSSGDFTKPKPSIHMPRWASRLNLTVTDVRVQRLQGIGEADAIAEGIERSPHGNGDQWLDYPAGSSAAGWLDPRESFRSLWDSINVARGFGWEANPWVVALSFTVDRRNIDQVAS